MVRARGVRVNFLRPLAGRRWREAPDEGKTKGKMVMRDDVPITSKARARAMRAEPTDAEKRLWHALRDRRLEALKFRRQAPIGPYIVDFVCVAHWLIVEADGSQHAENQRDVARDAWLAQKGYTVLRFTNRDILTARESVLATIATKCGLPW
jgi:very-short-patch-repair endonuclease